MLRWSIRLVVGLAVGLVMGTAVAAAATYDPVYEARQYAKIQERARSDYTPAFDAQLAVQGAENEAQGDAILATDGPADPYGRDPTGNLCFHHQNGCAGDIRLYDWGADGDGIVEPILFTQRNGSTLSGHVWMTRAGPAKRPGVVFTNGSIQAPEQLYWYAAEALAKDGYIVLTFDPQGQGYSDTYGEGADRTDGVPSQSGGPFFEGTEDALDFFFSTPSHPYEPRRSCSSGTSHDDKQDARVKAGLDSAYNPLWASLDTAHVGLAGHSLGAAAVSYIGQLDPRVDAIVALDDLSDVTQAGALTNFGSTITCASGSSHWPIPLRVTKPALGMSDDYGLTQEPYATLPDPAGKLGASESLTQAGVDSGELVIRGGTHYEFSYIPNPAFGATHRGMDMATWYLLAWFDKYLRHDPTADARLTTNRWCNDAGERAIDDQSPPDGDMFSTDLLSRLDIRRADGTRFDVENLRSACGTSALSPDPEPANFSFLTYDLTKDSAPTPGATTSPAGATGVPPAGRRPGPTSAPGCPPTTGSLGGPRLGPIRLGMTAAQVHRAVPKSSTRDRRSVDYLCLTPSGIRVGFPSTGLLRSLSRRTRARFENRVVLALTSAPRYAIRGVHAHAQLAAVARRLRLGRGVRIGTNTWYVVSDGSALGVLRAHGGTIAEIGVADRGLLGGARASRAFFASFT